MAVATLCRRLDGIPLALELAAVRLRSMPVEEILARLADRFAALGSVRTATSRHRTLRAAVAWSYELCTPPEQRLWATLSVFPGTFGLEAAEQVCGPGTFETLIRLVDKSIGAVQRGRAPLSPAGHDAGIRRGAARPYRGRGSGPSTATTTSGSPGSRPR